MCLRSVRGSLNHPTDDPTVIGPRRNRTEPCAAVDFALRSTGVNMGVNGGRACEYEQAQPKTQVKTELANRV